MLSWVQHRWTSLWLVIAALGALCLFLYGFFPLKYNSGKLAHMDDLPNFIEDVSIDGHEVYNSGENTVILMVIDGLRYDFVTEEHMPYAGQMLKNKSAFMFVSVAEPPTVTMPRIKSPERKKEKAQWRRTINFWRDIFAMMTGSVSTFADVALNFGAPAVQGDSVLRVAKSRGLRSVMYGDDTWLRLFPGLWAESDGTTSFFVTDYTEVDNNVTRHLDKVLAPDENKKPTFDFLVLHYLGLDHIGHLEGARSPKIKPKLLEMDAVIKKIYEAMQKWDRRGVLLVCGDHGMRDAGGHGGASPAEVLVPLLLADTRDNQGSYPMHPGLTVNQVDVAPSISWLLNCPIPGDSAGVILPSLLPSDVRQRLYLLHIQASEIGKRVPADTEIYKQYKRATKQFAHYLSTGQQSAAKIAKDFYEESLAGMAVYLYNTTTEFDVFAIGIATLCLYIITVALLCITIYSLQADNQKREVLPHHKPQTSKASKLVAFAVIYTIVASSLVTSCFLIQTKSQFCSFKPLWSVAFIAMVITITAAYFIIKSCIEKTKDLSALNELNAIDYLLVIGTLFHSWSFLGTSFIEEEHMTWYFLWNTLMLFILVRTIVVLVIYYGKKWSGATEVQEKPDLDLRMTVSVVIMPQWVLMIGLHRYLRTMNQTGDRWLFLPDTADWLNAPENSFYLELHCIIGTVLTLAVCLWNVREMNSLLQMNKALTVVAVGCIISYRVATGALTAPFPIMKTWDPVIIVKVFWGILISQFIFELLTYIGVTKLSPNKFGYKKRKEKTEDVFHQMELPWNIDQVKLTLANSLSHIMYNDMMLIVILLMRPHNVIMVPSIYFTCVLASICVSHKLLDVRAKRTEITDVLSMALVHLWIGMLFFFYQGNSNSLASVDLGSGYVGLREYSPTRVALRMGLHAYAGPALAGASLFCMLARIATDWQQYLNSIWRTINIFAFQRVYQLVTYCVIAMIFRHHLFVWTVFSPKLLYDFVATVFSVQSLSTVGHIVLITHITNFLARACTNRK